MGRPGRTNTIALSGDSSTITIADTIGNNTTTLQVMDPTTELDIFTGDGNNTVTIGNMGAFTGELGLIGGSGTNVLNGPSSTTVWTLEGDDAGIGGAATSAPINWSSGATLIASHSLTSVSCTTAGVCVAGDNAGDLLVTANPAGAWTTLQLDGTNTITGVSCNTTECVAVDNAGNAITASTPTVGPPSAWTVTNIDATNALTGVSCTSDGTICVAVDGVGDVVASSNPTGGASAWAVADVDGATPLTGVSCGTDALCLVVDNAGNELTSVEPTGGAGTWTAGLIDNQSPLTSVACNSDLICVAADTTGSLVTSEDPADGASSWSGVNVDGSTSITAISCASGLCVAGDAGGQSITDNDPGDGNWQTAQTALGVITGVSCATAQSCVAVDSSGHVLGGSAPAPSTGFGGSISFDDFATLNGSGSDTVAGAYADSTLWTITNPTTGSGNVVGTSAVINPDGTSTNETATELTFTGVSTVIGGLGDPGVNTIADTAAGVWDITALQGGTLKAPAATTGVAFIDFDAIHGFGTDAISGPATPTTGTSTGTTWTLAAAGGFTVEGMTVTGVTAITGSGLTAAAGGDTVIGPKPARRGRSAPAAASPSAATRSARSPRSKPAQQPTHSSAPPPAAPGRSTATAPVRWRSPASPTR